MPCTGRAPGQPGQDFYGVAYTNTDLATLAGGELFAEYDATNWLTPFGTVSYVEGTDHSRDRPGRVASLLRLQNGLAAGPRSTVAGSDDEALPGIPPLESRIGVRVHEPGSGPRWNVELSTRLVARQNRAARSLGEQATPAFALVDLRSYWQATNHLQLVAGVENLTDAFYREHLDFRTGRGVYQPGINFYFGSELTY